MTAAEPFFASAVIDPSGLYRYELTRRWGDGLTLLFVMLNPSTADAHVDDPTIRRCVAFARRDGFGSIRVVNLYAYRATKPEALWAARSGGVDIVGPDNDASIRRAVAASNRVVAAWGGKNRDAARARRVMMLLDAEVRCLGTTADGSPRHPLYLRGDTPAVSMMSDNTARLADGEGDNG